MSAIPRAVLGEALREAVGGGTLRAAVLTTFALEWAFTLDEVLPAFVPHTLSAAPTARRDELAEYLLAHDAALTVFCDHRHAGEFERVSRVPLAVVPVQHRGGVFHPKVTLALVDGEGSRRLVVAVGSANLTRAGWWEWVECAHVTSIAEGARTWMRDSLLGFLAYLRRQTAHAADRRSVDEVQAFLRNTRQAERRAAADEGGVVRFLWNGVAGQVDLVDAMAVTERARWAGGRLEVVSPWFSDDGDLVLRSLAERIGVGEVLAVVPLDPDGRAELPPEAVDRLGDELTWATLPRDVISAGPLPDAKPRHVHAKLYRFTRARQQSQTLLVGSFNLTRAAFGGAANVEAGLLVDLPTGGRLPWLEGREAPTAFAPARSEDDAENLPNSRLSELGLTYDWGTATGDARWLASGDRPPLRLVNGAVEVLTFPEGWASGPLTEVQATQLRTHLLSSSPVLTVLSGAGEDLGFTVVTEVEVRAKPSGDVDRQLSDAVADLLLDPETRRTRRRPDGTSGDDEVDTPDASATPVEETASGNGPDLFAGYAALYQAMAGFRAEVAGLGAAGRVREVEHRLVGESARCLGDLVTQAERGADGDPVMSLVVCWAVEEVLAALKPQLKGHSKSVTRVGNRVGLLRTALEARLAVENVTDSEFGRFLGWARAEFVGRRAR